MRLRPLILVTHRWLGLTAAATLSIVSATGVVVVWRVPSRLSDVAIKLHEQLGMSYIGLGRVGWWIVALSTVSSLLLVAGGLILWWRQRTFAVRITMGWRRAVADLHRSVGALGVLVMVLLAITGTLMVIMSPGPLRKLVVDLHSGRHYPLGIKIVYALGSIAFVFQAFSGLVMWWRRLPRKAG